MLGNAPGHPEHLCLVHPNTEVKNLSNATMSLWLPLNQGPTQQSRAITLVALSAVSWMQVRRPLLMSVNAVNHTAMLIA
jgi:hypothetical protein